MTFFLSMYLVDRHGRNRRRSCRGQALTEFLVLALALIPLLLLFPVIAKYQDIAHATQMAARYIAFEATAHNDAMSSWKPEGQLADEVRRRFFSNSEAPIKTDDIAGDFKAHQNLFWQDPRNGPLIKHFSNDIAVSFGSAHHPSHSGGFSATSDGMPFALKNEFGVQAKGIYTANISVALVNLPTLSGATKSYEPFDRINLSITRSTSVLIDPWTSSSPIQTELRSGDSPLIFPAGSLKAISPVVDAAITAVDLPGGLSGPKLGRLDFWRDVVPEDRLKPQ